MIIKLSKRLENEVRTYCKDNNIKLSEYISDCIEYKLALDRYGDLNEKFNIPKENIENKEVVKEDIKIANIENTIEETENKTVDDNIQVVEKEKPQQTVKRRVRNLN